MNACVCRSFNKRFNLTALEGFQRKVYNLLSIALILGLSVSIAQAEICVVVDEANDTLADDERKGALALARTSFESAGETITEPPCDAQYKISNVKLGSAIIIKVSGPKGNRTGKAEREIGCEL